MPQSSHGVTSIPLYLLVFCALLLGVAGVRAKPSINLYVLDRQDGIGLAGTDARMTEAMGEDPSAADSFGTAAASEAAALIGSQGPETPGAADDTEQGASAETHSSHKLGLLFLLNSYDEHEWQTIDGIGPALANRIVEYRELNGEFSALEELLSVNGIGAAKLQQIEIHFQQLSDG